MADAEDGQVSGRIIEVDAGSIVRDAYNLILKRSPDAEGFSHHISRLEDRRVSVIGLVAELMASDEARAMEEHPNEATTPSAAPTLAEAEAIVVDAFECVLNRAADEEAITSFSASLSTGKLSVIDLVGELLRSEEFEHRAIFNLRIARLLARVPAGMDYGRHARQRRDQSVCAQPAEESGFDLIYLWGACKSLLM